MLDKNERIAVEAVRKQEEITLSLRDGTTLKIIDRNFCRDVAIALQTHFNKNKQNEITTLKQTKL